MNLAAYAIDGIKAHRGRILNSLLAIASISLAHYAGFVMELPLQIIAAAGGAMAPGVTTTFLFYVALCAVLARVMVGVLQIFLLPSLLITDRAEHGYRLQSIGKKRKFVRSYNVLQRNEGYIWFGLQIFIFITCLLGFYVEFNLTWQAGGYVSLAIIFVALSGAFRTRFLLLLNWVHFINRIKYRSSFRLNAASAVFVTIASALVVTSFFVGSMRMSMLKKKSPQQVINQYFSGYARLLASSGSFTLLFEEDGRNIRYIYATSEYALAIESKINAFPMLSRH